MAFTKRFLVLPAFQVILFFVSLQTVSLGLKLTSVEVPSAVSLFEPVWLNCSLDLESDDLYSVQWYKNGKEFYRYLPRDTPPVQIYPQPGVYPNVNNSVQGHVYLERTDYTTEGLYRCEASGEAPNFQTVSAEKELKVYALPDEGPKILRSLPKYETGDYVNVSCISGKAYPPPVLKWYINGLEARAPTEILETYPLSNDTDGLISAQLDLFFQVESCHLRDGFLLLRCDMVVSHLYSMSTQEIITGERTRDDKGGAMHQRLGAPVISGGQERYRVGDTLDVNCTSANSTSSTDLKWFINDKTAATELLVPQTSERLPEDEERSTLGLRFVVKQSHFNENGELRLKCTATSSKVITMLTKQHKAIGSHVNKAKEASPK